MGRNRWLQIIMENECSNATDAANSSSSASTTQSAASTPAGSPSSPNSSPTSTSYCSSDSSVNTASSNHSVKLEGDAEGIQGAGGYETCLRRRCSETPPRSPNANMSPEKLIKSPPTPHKIQSLNEKSLRLDENYLAISPVKNGFAHNHLIPANHAKPLNSTHQNKT